MKSIHWSRAQVAGVGILALAVAAGTVAVLALGQYRSGAAPVTVATPWPVTTRSSSVPAAAGSSSPMPSASASRTTPAPATPSAAPTGLALAASILNSPKGASVLVFGDGSGNEDDEWVAAWARDHLARAAVTYRVWQPAGRNYSAAETFGKTAPAIQVWNGSIISPDMGAEPARIGQAWQPADLVFLSYGHRRSPTDITAQLNSLLAAIRAKDAAVPIVVMIQNPDRAASEATQRATTQKVQEWATAKGFATVDVYSAFTADPTPRNDMVESDGSPTPRGSQLWARTVAEALAAA